MTPSPIERLSVFPKSSGAVPRVLWRMRGPRRTIVATLCRHSAGHELVVAFEDNENDVIETQFDPADIDGLKGRAGALREILEKKGWVALGEDASDSRSPA